jgi:hypothetical protein
MTDDRTNRARRRRLAIAALVLAGCGAGLAMWARTPSNAGGAAVEAPPQWFGVYLEERKIGHARLALRDSRDGEPPSIVAESIMAVALAGGERRLEIEAARYYDREPPHPLIELRVRESSADGIGERRLVEPARASAETLATFTTQYLLEPGAARIGDRFELAELDVDSGRDRRVVAEVAARRSQLSFGVRAEVIELAIRRSGDAVETRTLIASGGKTLRARVGPFSFRAQDRLAAVGDIEGLDPSASAVAVDRPLGDPARIVSLEATLKSGAAFELPRAAGQSSRPVSGGRRVSVTVGPGEPLRRGARAAALEATAEIDHHHPSIALLSRRLAGGDRRAAVARMVGWVHDNLDKQTSTHLASASQVLAARRGDCTEHTALFVALARAARIPAREVSGLVYGGDEMRGFAWHAWAEVEIDGRWHRVDPSWGETAGNASHIALGVGPQSDWLTLLGDLEIAVHEVGTASEPALQ